MLNMQFDKRMRAMFFSVIIICLSIIHFAVGIAIVSGYRKYHDIFEQQRGLAGYNIFIGFFSIIVGIIGLVSAIQRSPLLSKVAAIGAFIFGIAVFASLITALVLSSQATSNFRTNIANNMNAYIQDEDAIVTIDRLQTDYQCCGVYLWLDWSRVQLGAVSGGRRRRRSYEEEEDTSPFITPLMEAVSRKKRQVLTPGSVYNLPSSYTVNLPLSCCKGGSGTATGGGSIGGYCVYKTSTASNSFYVRGCLEPTCNVGFAQITGIAVINTCLTMLLFVYFGKMIKIFPGWSFANVNQTNPNGMYQGQQQQQQQHSQQQNEYANDIYSPGQYYNYVKQPYQNNAYGGQQQQQYPYDQSYNYNGQQYQNGMFQGQQQQQQQYPYNQYYSDNGNSNPYYNYNPQAFQSYH